MSTTPKATPNRLTFEEHFAACSYIKQEQAIIETLSISAVVRMVFEATGITITAQQCRDMMDIVGVSRKNQEDDTRAIVLAMAARLNWPTAALITEGRKIIEKQDEGRIANSKKATPLPMPASPAPAEPIVING